MNLTGNIVDIFDFAKEDISSDVIILELIESIIGS